MKKLKLKLGSYHRNKACFSVEAWTRPVDSTFYYEDLLYMRLSCVYTCYTTAGSHLFSSPFLVYFPPVLYVLSALTAVHSSDPFLLSVPKVLEQNRVRRLLATLLFSLEAKLGLENLIDVDELRKNTYFVIKSCVQPNYPALPRGLHVLGPDVLS